MRYSFFTSVLLAGLACAPAVSTGGAGGVAPAPGAEAPAPAASGTPTGNEKGKAVALEPPAFVRYQFQRFDTLALQLPNGSAQSQTYAWSAWLDTRASRETNGFRLVITLDSLDVEASPPAPQAAMDSARGTRWTAHLDADGKLSSLQADRESSIAAQFAAMLRYLYPPLPGASVRSGATWTDSATVPTRAQNFEVEEHGKTEYVASGPVVHGDQTVLLIGGSGTFTRSGNTTQFGQAMQHQSAGQRRLTFYLGTNGVPAGLDGTESSKVTITVPAVGQSLTADQSGSFRVTISGTP
jgi:hypothetical protein